VGGLGCLGLFILGGVVIALFIRGFMKSDFMQGAMAMEQNQRQMSIRIGVIHDAIEAYKKDHKNSYPPDLKTLVPKYLPEDQIKTFELDPKTKLQWVYKKPKPNDPDSVVVLTHKPPVFIKGSFWGNRKDLRLEISFEYQLQKDGQVTVQQITTDPNGKKSTTTTTMPARRY